MGIQIWECSLRTEAAYPCFHDWHRAERHLDSGIFIIVDYALFFLAAVIMDVTACSDTQFCSDAVMDSVCDSTGVCTCLDGYRVADNLESCEQIGIGDACSGDGDCVLIINGECNVLDTQVCECLLGYEQDNSTACAARMVCGNYSLKLWFCHDANFLVKVSSITISRFQLF